MSRLDSVIRRLEAQRSILDYVANCMSTLSGPVFEVGLGNGRSYDHLRERMPERDIFVFERKVAAHPDCIPEDQFLFEGDLSDSLIEVSERFSGKVSFIHSDIGTGDPDRNARIANWLSDVYPPFLCTGGMIASDQELSVSQGLVNVDLPEGIAPGRYFLYRKAD